MSQTAMDNLVVLAIFKDEAPYLAEWLAFHLAQGVERFVLYNNRSTDGWAEVVSKFKDVVDVVPWYIAPPSQVPAYVSYFQGVKEGRFGAAYRRSRWVAVLDVDEFLCVAPGESKSLISVLDELGEAGAAGVGVNWMIYNASEQYEARPRGLQIEAYTMRCEADHTCNKHIKSIIDPMRAKGIWNPHAFNMDGPVVDELGRVIPQALTETATHTRLRINHYFIRSRQEWAAKVAKGRADTGGIRTVDEAPLYLGTVEDRSATAHGPAVRRILAERGVVID